MTTYKEAGVDIDAGNKAVERIKKHVKSTFNKETLTDIGGFGGCFEFPKSDYDKPVLVSSADGVGTKLKIAFLTGKHDTIGQCLVNHCVNDILAIGAKPLFFLDYFATGVLDVNVFEDVIRGLSIACSENQCSLIGGETAEMPGFYKKNEYDISGTITGVVEKEGMLSNRNISNGDILLGLHSTGLHTNGYSLARKVLLTKFKVGEYIEDLGETVGESLLSIHRSYLAPVSNLLEKDYLVGISHITGGGIVENTERIIHDGQSINISWDKWDWPYIFKLIQNQGNVPTEDMRRSMNLGIGMILVIKKEFLSESTKQLDSVGQSWVEIGNII